MSYYRSSHHSPLLDLAHQIVGLELTWPLPLLALGILQILNPLFVGPALVLALIPWLARLLVFGRLTCPVFAGGAMGLFIISGFASTWAAYDPALSWPLLLTLLGSVSLFFAVANAGLSPRLMGGGLVVAAGLMALYFVGQYAHFDLPLEAGRLARLGRITGSLLPDLVLFTPHPNAMAGFLEGAFLFSLVLTWRARGGERLAWGLAAVVIAYGLLISGSRGAWIGLAVAVGIWILLSIPNRTLRLTIGGAGIVTILLAVFAAAWLMSSGQQGTILGSALNTANSRLILYRNSLYLLGDYIFSGIGLGDTFAMVYSRYQLLIRVPFLVYSHNLFLSVGLGYGLLGLAALAWLLIGLYRFVVRVERAGLRQRWLPIFRVAWLGATAIFVHGLTDSPHFGGAGWTMPMLFALLGLVAAAGRLAFTSSSEMSEETAVSGLEWIVWAAIAGTLLLVSVVFWRPIAGAGYINLGAIHHTRSDLSPGLSDTAREMAAERAAAYFATALDLGPAQPAANRRLGLLALDRENFETAVTYLESAYRVEPGNQATLKALGLAYLWTGNLDSAAEMLRQLDDRDELVEELGNWAWWWKNTQERPDLSTYAAEMVQRLSQE